MGAGQYRYTPTGSPWAFPSRSGIAANGSGFTAGNPPAPEGTQVAFLQKTGSFSQAVAGWAAGSYRLDLLRRPARQQRDVAAGLPGPGRRRRGRHLHPLRHVVPDLHDGRLHRDRRVAHRSRSRGSTPPAATTPPSSTRVARRTAPCHAASPTGASSRCRWGPASSGTDPTGSPWTFTGRAGIAANGSGFTAGNPPAPEGTQVAFLQKTGSFSQAVAGWAAGSYRLTFYAAQRGNTGTSRQDFRVLVDGVVVGTFTPSGTSYQVLTTAAFTRHGRVAHDRVPGIEQRRRRQHRLHRSDFRCRGLVCRHPSIDG